MPRERWKILSNHLLQGVCEGRYGRLTSEKRIKDHSEPLLIPMSAFQHSGCNCFDRCAAQNKEFERNFFELPDWWWYGVLYTIMHDSRGGDASLVNGRG